MLDDEVIPETEVFIDDDAISDTFDDVYAAEIEATQPPILTQYNRWILYNTPRSVAAQCMAIKCIPEFRS